MGFDENLPLTHTSRTYDLVNVLPDVLSITVTCIGPAICRLPDRLVHPDPSTLNRRTLVPENVSVVVVLEYSPRAEAVILYTPG